MFTSSSTLDTTVRRIADMRAEWKWWLHTDHSGALPSLRKRRLLRSVGRRFGLKVLVETGTYLGDTVAAVRRDFRHVYSIELGHELARAAQSRFSGANVTILEGDSGRLLSSVVSGLAEPALFWLDGHYSGAVTARGDKDTPVLAELQAILASPVAGHVLLIDDIAWVGRQVGVDGIQQLRERITAVWPTWTVEERNDVLRAYPAPIVASEKVR
jgi:hypothetical protein